MIISLALIFFTWQGLKNNQVELDEVKHTTTLIKREYEQLKKQIAQPKYKSDEFQAGMNVLIYGHPEKEAAIEMFQHLRKLGINSVAIVFPIYQMGIQANEVKNNPMITPTMTEIRTLIDEAHAIGLSVMLRPILDEESFQAANMWRGQIKPTNPEAWFDSYQSLLLTYAKLAQATDVEIFNIGTEFNSLQKSYQAQWQRLIHALREAYQGELIYSFNWDTVHDIPRIEFVDLLDYVGIDAYFPLHASNGASVETLEKAWDKWIDQVKRPLKNKSVVITESGIVPVRGAYRTPYSWQFPNGKLDWDAQAHYYEATYRVWKPLIQGIYWWSVTLDENPGAVNYSPLHSQTEFVIKRHFLKNWKND